MNRRVLVAAALVSTLWACKSNGREDDRSSEPEYQDLSRQSAGTSTRASTPKLSSEERRFTEEALRSGQFEIEISRLALQKASSGKVRDFATMMVADHGQANRDLESLARKNGIYAPTTLDPDNQAKLDELRRLDGPAFDKEFQEVQVALHDRAIRSFDEASRECRDEELRNFVIRTLPTLQQHRSYLDDVAVATSKGD